MTDAPEAPTLRSRMVIAWCRWGASRRDGPPQRICRCALRARSNQALSPRLCVGPAPVGLQPGARRASAAPSPATRYSPGRAASEPKPGGLARRATRAHRADGSSRPDRCHNATHFTVARPSTKQTRQAGLSAGGVGPLAQGFPRPILACPRPGFLHRCQQQPTTAGSVVCLGTGCTDRVHVGTISGFVLDREGRTQPRSGVHAVRSSLTGQRPAVHRSICLRPSTQPLPGRRVMREPSRAPKL